MKIVKRENIYNLLQENKTNIFTVVFIKKNGELRKMNCRLQVIKHLKGGKLAFNPVKRGLLPVYDLVKKGYRMINLETLQSVSMKGETYKIEEL